MTLATGRFDRLRGIFGSDPIFTATGSSAEPLEPSHLKQVTYEVYGRSDTTGSVSYLDKDAQPERANFAGLSWTFTITTTVPAVIANVVAQGDSDSCYDIPVCSAAKSVFEAMDGVDTFSENIATLISASEYVPKHNSESQKPMPSGHVTG